MWAKKEERRARFSAEETSSSGAEIVDQSAETDADALRVQLLQQSKHEVLGYSDATSLTSE